MAEIFGTEVSPDSLTEEERQRRFFAGVTRPVPVPVRQPARIDPTRGPSDAFTNVDRPSGLYQSGEDESITGSRATSRPIAPRMGLQPVTAPTVSAIPPSIQPQAPRLGTSQTQPTPLEGSAETLRAQGPPRLGGWKKGLDIAGQLLVPGLEALIPGTPGNYQQRLGQAEAEESRQLGLRKEQANISDIESQSRLRESQAVEAQRKAQEPPKPENIQQAYSDAVQAAVARGDDPNTDPTVLQFADAIQRVQKEAAPKETKYESKVVTDPLNPGQPRDALFDPIKGMYIDPDTRQPIPGAKPYEKPEKPERPPRQLMLVPQPDGSSKAIEVTPGTVVPKGAETAPEFGKAGQPTADEQRRADLGKNLNENLDAYEDIVKRRPDLFGPVAGRLTAAKMMTGSSDPDISALRAIKEFAGMAAVGTHAMRNAQHVKIASDAMMNLYDQPEAILKGPLVRARQSIKTFTGDVSGQRVQNQPTSPAAGGGGGQLTAPKIGEVVDGHKFKGGDPADKKNWEKVATVNAR